MRDYWINKAIREAGGSVTKLAQKIGVSRQSMSFIRNHAKKIPLEIAIKIEIATNGAVSRFHLADHLDPKIKRKLLEEKPDKPLRISEQGLLALAYEKTLGNRKGTRSDLQPRENFPKVMGRTEEIAAEYGGFGNYKTYRQFKKINQDGCFELIMAMDNKRIGISTAAKLADLPHEEQRRVLQLTKKEIIAYIRRDKLAEQSSTKLLTKTMLDEFFLNNIKIYLELSSVIKE
jgi:DNA-binding transcriptional regulator YdaS (Cro superfamily)